MSNLITGKVTGTPDDGFFGDVSFKRYEEAFLGLKHDYGRKAAVGINSLFFPYSCDPSGSVSYNGDYNPGEFNMPHFLAPSSGATEPTVLDIHPFQSGHNIGFTTFGNRVPRNSNPIEGDYPELDQYRGIALRGPLVITGPCYDTDGNPYPRALDSSGNPTGSGFREDYLRRPDLWATGPVDLRFDVDRGVYVAGLGGGSSKIVKVLASGDNFPIPAENMTTTPFRKVYRVQEYKVSFEDEEGADASLSKTGDPFYAANFRSNVILADRYYICHQVNGGHVLDNQAAFLEYT